VEIFLTEPVPPARPDIVSQIATDTLVSVELLPPPGCRVRVMLRGETEARVFDFAHRDEAMAFYRALWAKRPESDPAEEAPPDTSSSSGP
jgi:hypothetical protein